MLLTRNLVNKNIQFHDYVLHDDGTFSARDRNYDHFSSLVDAYKNLFLSKGALPGQTVVIGTKAKTEQIALTIACAELGLIVTIVGGLVVNPAAPANRDRSKPINNNDLIIDAYRSILPIDWFVVMSEECTSKFSVFKETCNNTILLNQETLDYTPNDKILAKPEGTFLKCTSSGTTGAPKIILHTHAFFTTLIQRNSVMFYGKMGLLDNLNHGSSPGTYFLPALVSEKVTDFYSFIVFRKSPTTIARFLQNNMMSIDHLMVPYTQLIDDFFHSTAQMKDCVLYTLGVIRQSWVDKLKDKVKDIISIFGSNETSGPLFINQATDVDFAENSHKKLDDFYTFTITDKGELEITVPVYNRVVPTADLFTVKNGKYFHGGRSNLFRINDLEINGAKYQEIIDGLMRAELIIDTSKDRIYLAVWDSAINESAVKQIDDLMKQNSEGRHYISNSLVLKQENFLSGVKLNKEALREYFRRNM